MTPVFRFGSIAFILAICLTGASRPLVPSPLEARGKSPEEFGAESGPVPPAKALDPINPACGLADTVLPALPAGAIRLGNVPISCPGATAVHFPVGGKTIMAARWPEVREWDLATKTLIRRYHLDIYIRELLSTSDGRFLLARGWDSVYVINRADGSLIHHIHPPDARDKIECFAVSRNGKLLATGTDHGQLLLWNIARGNRLAFRASHPRPKPRHERFRGPVGPPPHPPRINHVAFMPDGESIVSGSTWDDVIRAWDVVTSKELWALPEGLSCGGPFAMSPDGKSILAPMFGLPIPVDDNSKLRFALWSVADRKPVVELDGHVWPCQVAFSPDRRFVATGGYGPLTVWDSGNGKSKFTVPISSVYGLEFSPDSRFVACIGDAFGMWEVETGREVLGTAGHIGAVARVAVSGDGKLIVTGGSDGTVRVWEAATGKQLSVRAHESQITGVAISPDRSGLASHTERGIVRVWETATGTELHRFDLKQGLDGLSYSPDGKVLGVGGANLTVYLFDLESGKEKASFVGLDGIKQHWSSPVHFSADGKRLVARVREGPGGGPDRASANASIFRPEHYPAFDPTLGPGGGPDRKSRVVLWDIATGKRVAVLGPSTDSLMGFALSPDGNLLALGDYLKKEVVVVEWRTGNIKYRLPADVWNHLAITNRDLLTGRTRYNLDTGKKSFELAERQSFFAVFPDGGKAVVWSPDAVFVLGLPDR